MKPLSFHIRPLLIVSALVLPACSDAGGVTTIVGCRVVSQTGSWQTGDPNSWEFTPVFNDSRRCPIAIVQPLERITTSGFVNGYQDYDGALPTERAIVTVFNTANAVEARDVFPFYRESVNYIEAQVYLTFRAATGGRSFSDTDDMSVLVDDYCCALPQHRAGIRIRLTYTPDGPARVLVAGEEIPLGSTPHTWRATSSSAGHPHEYRWYRNGVQVGSGESYTADSGTQDFTLRADMTDVYGRTATHSMLVDVDGIRSSMSGPNLVYLSEGGGTWSTSVRGGHPPYQYTWSIDEGWAGDQDAWSGYTGEGSRMLRVNVRDAWGAVHSSEMQVMGIGSEQCVPEPPAIACVQ